MRTATEGCHCCINYVYLVPDLSSSATSNLVNIPDVSHEKRAEEAGIECMKPSKLGGRILTPLRITVEDDNHEHKPKSDNRPSNNTSVYVLTLLSLIALYTFWLHRENRSLLNSFSEPWRAPDEKMADLVHLLLSAHDSLNQLQVPHYLCYSTLWGAVYTGAILPWDKTVNLCVLEEDITRVDEAFLHNTFLKTGVESSYSSENGFYTLKLRQAEGTLTVFRKVNGKRVRAGFHTRLLLLFHKDVESFPDRLLEDPFVNISFYGQGFMVPKESVDFIEAMSQSELLTKLHNL